MKNRILKTTLALSLACLSMLCVVKNEGEKKPIVMKQMASAYEEIDESFTAPLSEEMDSDDMHEEVQSEGSEELQEGENEDNQSENSQQQLQGGNGDYSSSVIEYDGQDLSIVVFGNSHLSVSPDKATITARVESFEKNIDLSKEKNLSLYNNIISAINGKAGSEIVQLDCFNCLPYYDYSNGRNLQGYHCVSSFSVNVPESEQVEQYISLLTDNGVSGIDNVCYEVSNMDQQYSLALSQAVENAKMKAEAIAGEGISLVKLKEKFVYSNAHHARCLSMNQSSCMVGKVEIEAQVVAIFEK